jgi:hypothetical protein
MLGKRKLPKAKRSAVVMDTIKAILNKRLDQYPGHLEVTAILVCTVIRRTPFHSVGLVLNNRFFCSNQLIYKHPSHTKQDDENRLRDSSLKLNQHNSLIVKIGEQRILQKALHQAHSADDQDRKRKKLRK